MKGFYSGDSELFQDYLAPPIGHEKLLNEYKNYIKHILWTSQLSDLKVIKQKQTVMGDFVQNILDSTLHHECKKKVIMSYGRPVFIQRFVECMPRCIETVLAVCAGQHLPVYFSFISHLSPVYVFQSCLRH